MPYNILINMKYCAHVKNVIFFIHQEKLKFSLKKKNFFSIKTSSFINLLIGSHSLRAKISVIFSTGIGRSSLKMPGMKKKKKKKRENKRKIV